jgi:hypothetical protein
MEGDAYIASLAKWLRAHEKALASGNTLALLQQQRKTSWFFGADKALLLHLDLYHLAYILLRFEEAGLPIGASLDIPYEGQPLRPLSLANVLAATQDTSDTKSFISASLSWFSSSDQRPATGAQVALDLKYLYSAFTKLPSLHLSPFPKAPFQKAIEGFELPTEGASYVPLYVFKNLSHLVR